MKKSILLVALSSAILLASCSGGGSTTSSSSSSSSSISTSTSTSSSTETSTSTSIVDPTPIGINSIISKPSNVIKGETIDPTSVLLLIDLDDGSTIQKTAESVECDASTASSGDVIKATAHYKTFEIEFNVTVIEVKEDELTASIVPGIGASYQEESAELSVPETNRTYKIRMIQKNDIYYGEEKATDYKLSFAASNTKGQPGLVMSKSDAAAIKVTINWSLGKDKVESNPDAKYKNEGKKIYLFAGENDLPFVDVDDLKLSSYRVSDALKVFEFDANNASQTFYLPSGVHYLGLKSSASVYLDSIKCSWLDSDKPATVKSLAISGTPHAECSKDTKWSFDDVTVIGTLSDNKSYDLTRYCSLSSETAVPTVHTETINVTVTATYLFDSTITNSANLVGAAKEITEITVSGSPKAEVGDTTWDLSSIKAIATYNDASARDITLECDITSSTSIPLVATAECDVEVKVVWTKNTSKTITSTLKGSVEIAQSLAASWSYKDTSTGGTLSVSNFKNDSSNLCYIDAAAADVIGYIQVLSDTKIMTASSATFVASIGGGSAKTFESSDYYVMVSLLDSTGAEIAGSSKEVTNALKKAATDYTVSYTSAELATFGDVYGVRLSHKKLSNYNARFYNFQLLYIPAI